MAEQFWFVRSDFKTASPKELVQGFWQDDEAIRAKSLGEFSDWRVVDRGMELYIEALRGVMTSATAYKDDQHRAIRAMFAHGYTQFMVWRHLASLGYQNETGAQRRRIHEAIVYAFAFAEDSSLAAKFYRGQQVGTKEARIAAASFLGKISNEKNILSMLNKHYLRLSHPEHPSLLAFRLRAARTDRSSSTFAASVPEQIVYGGFTSNTLMVNSIAHIAQNLKDALDQFSILLGEGTGRWDKDQASWGEEVESLRAKANDLSQEFVNT